MNIDGVGWELTENTSLEFDARQHNVYREDAGRCCEGIKRQIITENGKVTSEFERFLLYVLFVLRAKLKPLNSR